MNRLLGAVVGLVAVAAGFGVAAVVVAGLNANFGATIVVVLAVAGAGVGALLAGD